MAADKHFDVRPFITGAKAAYETVVTAYADGDRRTLTNLLAPDVYEGFEAVIRERKDRGETAATRFLSIDATHITAAELRGKTAYITLRFVSQLVSATRDRDGKVIEGDAVNVTNVSDVLDFRQKCQIAGSQLEDRCHRSQRVIRVQGGPGSRPTHRLPGGWRHARKRPEMYPRLSHPKACRLTPRTQRWSPDYSGLNRWTVTQTRNPPQANEISDPVVTTSTGKRRRCFGLDTASGGFTIFGSASAAALENVVLTASPMAQYV